MQRLALLVWLSLAGIAAAQDAPPYGGLEAATDSLAPHEAQRQDNINRQLQTIDQLQWWRGLPPRGAGVYVERYPPSLDYIYVTGRRGLFGGYRERVYFGTSDIFTPWPYVPGDIWSPIDDRSVRQPIGQRQIQTGPNRWESHPVYAEPIRPPLRLEAPPVPSGPREF